MTRDVSRCGMRFSRTNVWTSEMWAQNLGRPSVSEFPEILSPEGRAEPGSGSVTTNQI